VASGLLSVRGMKTNLALATFLLTGCVAAQPDDTEPAPKVHRSADTAATRATPVAQSPQLDAYATTGNGIDYHGGPIMSATPTIYFIWYGNWTNAAALSILPDFIHHLGGSYYFNINTTYDDNTGHHVPNAVRWGGYSFDNYSHGGGTLSGGDIKGIVENALDTGALPSDPTGIYLVLTSKDVNQNLAWGLAGSFCSDFCGWHNHGTINGNDVRYAFIGDPTRCVGGTKVCAQYSSTPNGDYAADGMASVIAHEIEETATDPDIDAWYDSNGDENADKCAWHFGTQYRAPNGAWANMRLGTRDYLIQQNWVNAEGGSCALAYTRLTASAAPALSGSVSSSPSGITCTGTCSKGFTPGSTVTLTATPLSGHVFSSWQGCDSISSTGQCRVTMSGNRSVVANFACATTLDQACYDDCLPDCMVDGKIISGCAAQCRQNCGGC